jgi:hypothetical protein
MKMTKGSLWKPDVLMGKGPVCWTFVSMNMQHHFPLSDSRHVIFQFTMPHKSHYVARPLLDFLTPKPSIKASHHQLLCSNPN